MRTVLKFDEAMTAYLEYAALIEGKPVKNFLAKTRRQFKHLTGNELRMYVDMEIMETVRDYETRNRLPQSTSFALRPNYTKLWNRMLANRARLAN